METPIQVIRLLKETPFAWRGGGGGAIDGEAAVGGSGGAPGPNLGPLLRTQ